MAFWGHFNIALQLRVILKQNVESNFQLLPLLPVFFGSLLRRRRGARPQ